MQDGAEHKLKNICSEIFSRHFIVMEGNNMNEQVAALAAKLSLAVEITMSPSSTQQERMESFRLMEEFKDSSPLCPAVALQLAQDSQPGPVRRFGLQVLESCIKYRWTKFCTDDKVFIKDNAMHLMAFRTSDLLEEPQYIKDALSRIIVEMIKQEWPQQWPEMLSELEALCQRGPTQTELVLFVFLRLVEDVVAFSAVPPKRRRELLTGLTSQMLNLFTFFINTLDKNVALYVAQKSSDDADKKREALACVKVSQAVLWTFTGYVDWVSMPLIFENNGRLLQMLCTLLSDEHLQMYAAECLLLIVSRKGTVLERKPLLLLFSEDAMNTILSAAVVATAAAVNEYHYLFLKKLCNILVAIGNQLCALWGSEADVNQPPNFLKYLQAILALTEHPSQMLGSMTQPLWGAFLRHEHISKDPLFKEYIVKVLQTSLTSLAKVGYPSLTNSLSCGYALLDFDNNDREFNTFFSRYRADVMNTIRMTTIQMPCVAFRMATQRLDALLKTPLVIGEGTETDHCNLSSPSYIDWDALTSFIEAVMSRCSQSPEPQPDAHEGVQWLRAVLYYETKDPLILSLQLSCISALFQYLAHAPQLVDEVLGKIFSTVVFNVDGQTKSNRTRAVQNVRRHACSGLVKLCKTYPKLIMPSFDRMYQHIQEIINKEDLLSSLEKITLTESAIIISNEFKNYEKQSAFLAEVLKPSKDIWLSKEIQEVFQTPAKFMSFIGVDQAPVEPSSADTCGINRAKLQYCVSFIHAVINRTRWPTDPEEMRSGGFLIKIGDMEVPRNPATHQIGKMFGNLFPLLKILNDIWLPENLALRHPEFSHAYDLMEREKLQVLGIEPSHVTDNTNACNFKQPLERMQNFIGLLGENSYHVLGNAAQCLGYEFYTSSLLTKLLLETTFQNIEILPDHKLKPFIRVFLKPFVQYCPKQAHETVVLPIVNRLAPFMLEKLSQQWQKINLRAETCDEDADEDKASQECIDDQLCRQVTREYMEFLVILLFEKPEASRSDQAADDSMMVEEENPSNVQREVVVSELGTLALRSENTCQSIVLTAYNAMSWNDTWVSQRAISMCWPIMKQLIADNNMVEMVALHLFQSIMSGFEMHGQHDGNRSSLMTLALNAYEVLRPDYPELLKIMYLIPECTPTAVKKFDDNQLSTNPARKVNEKKKKDAFKRLIAGVISENVGKRFKKEANYTTLPPLFRKTKLKTLSLDDQTSSDLGLCALFNIDD